MTYLSGLPTTQRSSLVCREAAQPRVYYHYTSLETLWAVLDGETLRATQACFSNDSEEVQKGKALVAEICNELCNRGVLADSKKFEDYAKQLTQNEEDGIDCYIVCFCQDDDKLSQWRAYCRNDGVSIGFAFDGTQQHYYFSDEPVDNQPGRKAILYPVWYLDDSAKAGKNPVGNVQSKETVMEDILKDVGNIERLADFQRAKASLEATIPLIKHAGFYEEEEYRLLISNSLSAQGGNSPFPLDPYVQIRQDGGLRCPYVNISFGKKYPEETKAGECAVETICLYNVPQKLSDLIHKRFKNVKVCNEDNIECLQNQIVIGPGRNELQQIVFEKIEHAVAEICTDEEKAKIKIWCDGHLPIRSIRVSPCSNQDQVIKSIRHYCNHNKFWLKYVDVVGSSIPYRRPK